MLLCQKKFNFWFYISAFEKLESTINPLFAVSLLTPACHTVRHARRFDAKLRLLEYATFPRPLRALTRKGVEFVWTKDHDLPRKKAKDILCGPLVMTAYNPNKTCSVYTDASGDGLGFLMTQLVAPEQGQPDKLTERLIWAGSRTLSGPESRYPPILKEATAISHALTKLHIYLKFSKPFFLYTDHSPLANLHAGSLETAPERLLPLLEHWRGYPVTIKYIPGRSGGKIPCADFLSRPPPEPSHVRGGTGA